MSDEAKTPKEMIEGAIALLPKQPYNTSIEEVLAAEIVEHKKGLAAVIALNKGNEATVFVSPTTNPFVEDKRNEFLNAKKGSDDE